jgi:hypothetical protein
LLHAVGVAILSATFVSRSNERESSDDHNAMIEVRAGAVGPRLFESAHQRQAAAALQ